MGKVCEKQQFVVSHRTLGSTVTCDTNEDAVCVLNALVSEYKGDAPKVAKVKAAAASMLSALKDISSNYDHDEDAHRYGTTCRKCLAQEMVALATGAP